MRCFKGVLAFLFAAVMGLSVSAETNQIRVASFNIQNFGKTKAKKPEVMTVLADIITQYDVVAVQEVSDRSGQAVKQLLKQVNDVSPGYAMIVSDLTGRDISDKTSQEQYAYFFKTNTVRRLGTPVLFNDQHDDFQREPFLARFQAVQGNFSFVLINIHTNPDQAVEEICALDSVMAWAKVHFPGEDDFIALGDFNGSCSYAKPAELDACPIRSSRYRWIVPDDADTNLAARRCAYDRFVLTKATVDDYAGIWGVNRAFEDKKVSDHWPIWAAFYVNRDTGQ